MRTYIFLLLSSLLLLSSCATEKSDTPLAWDFQWGYVETLEKASSKIKDTKEFEDCMKPNINMCVSQVGNALARAQKSVTFCEELPDSSGRDACKYGVISIQAMESADIKICDTLVDTYKRECRISIMQSDAVTTSNLKKCDLLASEYPKSMTPGDTQSQDRIDGCKMSIITQKNPVNEDDCDEIKSVPMKNMCQSLAKSQSQRLPTADIN